MYDTAEEAKQKVENSIVLFNGNPVFIVGVGGKKGSVFLKFKTLPLGGAEDPQSVDISDPRWDFKSCGMKLGYTLVHNPNNGYWESVYVSRTPIRTSRQGLDDKTVCISYVDPSPTFHYNVANLAGKESKFKDTIRNVYPSSKEVFDRVTTQGSMYRSVPINRKLVLMYDRVSPPYLLYRNEKIGYTEDGLRFKLAKHKDFLREELTDMMGLKVA